VELLVSLPVLAVFYFKGNTAWRHITHLRKKLINGLPTLTYFEDKPVHDIDRITAMAWKEGGLEAEKKARIKFNEQRDADEKKANAAISEIRAEGKQHRKAAMKKMFEEMREKKAELMDKRDDLKAQYKRETDSQQQILLNYKIRDVDAELKGDYVRILEERGEFNEVFQYKKPAPQPKNF